MNENSLFPDRTRLQEDYAKCAAARNRVTKDLEARIEQSVRSLPSRISVKARAKDFLSYYKKYLKLLRQEPDSPKPVIITDIIGVRVVCPFIEDLDLVEPMIAASFEVIEVERKGAGQTFKEFGYQSTHLLITIPEDIRANRGFPGCDVAEIQIRTILQDAWAEVEHELVYKAEFTPFDEPMKRKLAAVNANLSLADIIFQEIRTYQRLLNGELEKRRDSFYKKIEESTDAMVLQGASFPRPLEAELVAPFDTTGKSIDDLLLAALSAHNGNRFEEAIALYTRMLDMNPGPSIAPLIYKHRGMAYFAQSQYREAIEDFTRSLELEKDSYKSAYYRGIVRVVLEQYQEAIEDFTLSLTIHPYQSFCLFRRAQAWYHLGDFPQALADCESAITLWPESPVSSVMEQFHRMLLNKLKM
jgi:putative GTP pyrophosphokinase